MRVLNMRAIGGVGILRQIKVDECNQIGSGGFGTIFPVSLDDTVVVKRLDLDRPRPLGDIRSYTAHITVTKGRLQRILDEERNKPIDSQRKFIIKNISEILDYSLSTHLDWELNEDNKIMTLWFMQRKAVGMSLDKHFKESSAPPENIRKRIARHVVTRMRTLRRADLVHLDCVHENIFYDPQTDKVTVIDLDGCGVIKRQSEALNGNITFSNQWESRPFTLGHTKLVRVPPWYPQPSVQGDPRTGYYLFAERWVVLDTVIRILTWNKMTILSWLEDVEMRNNCGKAYREIQQELVEVNNSLSDPQVILASWATALTTKMGQLSLQYTDQLFSRISPEFWQKRGFPACLSYFSEMAQRAFLDPRLLSSKGSRSLYDEYLNELL